MTLQAIILSLSLLFVNTVGTTETGFAAEEKNEKVEKFFQAMRDGNEVEVVQGFDFPQFDWEDIPALLALAESERDLDIFVANPLSSRFVPKVREGIYSLWLVEGIRKGGKFASLNPICRSIEDATEDGVTGYEKSQKKIAAAYSEWWSKREKMSRDELRKLDPLKDTAFSWR